MRRQLVSLCTTYQLQVLDAHARTLSICTNDWDAVLKSQYMQSMSKLIEQARSQHDLSTVVPSQSELYASSLNKDPLHKASKHTSERHQNHEQKPVQPQLEKVQSQQSSKLTWSLPNGQTVRAADTKLVIPIANTHNNQTVYFIISEALKQYVLEHDDNDLLAQYLQAVPAMRIVGHKAEKGVRSCANENILCKNNHPAIYKIKDPAKKVRVLASLCAIAADGTPLYEFNTPMIKSGRRNRLVPY